MSLSRPHLFVDISSHGLGHLAQSAPILNKLAQQRPDVRLTIRSGIAPEKLRARIIGDFTHLPQRSDFGFIMHDAVRIDEAATAQAYRSFHADWPQRVAAEADFLDHLKPDLVLTDVAYLPLAGAAQAGIASLSMCSLNWADLFSHVFGHEPWAPPIHHQILSAYREAEVFLRLTPAMPMTELPRLQAVGPVAGLGRDRRVELHTRLGCRPGERLVLVAFGGFDKDLNANDWPAIAGVHWLVPQNWPATRADMSALEALDWPFIDLVSSVDALLTKPGYGTFAEAACNGTPVLYTRRDDWPEQDCLIDWLREHARSREIGTCELMAGAFAEALTELWRQPAPPRPVPSGATAAATAILEQLTRRS
jgi:hypothetical protein